VRLDAVARFLQDAAIDDAQETGWGAPEHLWVVRRIRVDVVAPLLHDRELEITTWCSGVAAIAAGRRWSVSGDAGGRVEVDSVWIHLGADQRPGRIGDFGPYAASAAGRSASTKLLLPDPPDDVARSPWALRSTDLDAHGHVNNAVYWQAVEDVLARDATTLRQPLRAELDYRDPIDLGDRVELAPFNGEDARRHLAFLVDGRVRAVAAVGPLGA
jgi:acyl-ACP thioesterase